MDKVLLDTDVMLDFFFDRKPFSEETSRILSLCEKEELKGFVTSVALSNMYYLLRKTAKHEKVMASLKMLLEIVDVVTTDKATILEALNSGFKDFEDALQNFSTQNNQGIHIVITRNIKDYKTSKLSVMTPEMYLKSIKYQ
ncbi:PIN domain-containing protein [Crocinitomicaceae bacterium CZZ-1]|uniref:PIN domain-containing protein n=1 Tax=Taishania pollutisoli TaxID=2766479 RepID=A0A8J6PFK8_9FLAO|nr:PIN domain-containing protein [Taishania pollutisoli]MBC9813505.1 PIN domain-containing protein [Taishania pollutisoli]